MRTIIFSMRTLCLTLLLAGVTHVASAQISIRSGLAEDRSTSPGESYDGRITIVNESEAVQSVRVYQNDYRFYADGTNHYGTPGEDPRSNADWIVISSSVVNIPPRQISELAYTVHIPDTTPAFPVDGSYWSMVMIEIIPPGKEGASTEVGEIGLRQVLRYGVQIASHVGNTATGKLIIDHSKLSQDENGDTALILHVANRGNLMLRPKLWVELYDTDGNSVGRFDGAQNRLYPETSVMQKIKFGLVEPGQYNAIVVMDAGNEDIFGTEFTLDILESAEAPKGR